ncbi:hypothetical protein K2173_009614 [Erythroxylum novogranatense]|uniref:Bifunctional inhibitor/plant lipid transfer protein/seed storage helical domain-containing protein n=1 Tax=Erythroxylum novogranatense TaxID=1862640 RepID=A0AAV8U8M0_9ROSI|nr:hypothetical protein K2173_009614 [Erythroxylum novogranatense]
MMKTFQKMFIIGAVVLVAIGSNGIFEVSNAQTICNMPASGLTSCKGSVTPPNPTPPTTECCSALSHADLRCLCSYRNSKLLPTLGIDPNLAMQLPDKCKLPRPAKC